MWHQFIVTHNTNTPTLVSFGCRLPVLRADHRQAHLALLINIGVIDFCLEGDLGGLERVLGGENYFNSECTFVIRRVVLKDRKVVCTGNSAPRDVRVTCIEILLTGTISPCHDKRFDSSTWMFLKFFIPDLRISSSSWETQQTTLITELKNVKTRRSYPKTKENMDKC